MSEDEPRTAPGAAATGHGMALAGAVCGGVAVVLFVAYVVFVILVEVSSSS
jgi:hypothetical protein